MSIFAIIGLALWSQSPHAQGIPTPSPTPEEQADKPTGKSAPNPSGIPVTIIETLEQAKAGDAREKESHDHDAKDLDAQIRAADAGERGATAAEWQIIPTWLGAILSFIGTCLILWTLFLTRQANYISRDTSRRQLRAYLFTSGASFERIEGGFILTVELRNSGQTPAFKVFHMSQSFVDDYPVSSPPEFLQPGNTHGTPVGPGESFFCAQRLLGPKPDAILAKVLGGTCGLYIQGVVNYEDCFGAQHRTQFRYVFGGKFAQSGGMTLHADAHGNEGD